MLQRKEEYNMRLRHRVDITVSKDDGTRIKVLKGGSFSIRSRILGFLFGESVNVLVISPGKSVESIAIQEIPADKKGGKTP
jgi:hypothetical protein